MSVLFFHRANDYTGSTRALATLIELEYSNKDIIVVTLDNNGGGFLTNMSKVQLKKIYSPSYKNIKIKYFSYFISNLHMFFISLFLGYKFDTFYVNTIVPYPAVIGGRLMGKNIIYHIHEKFVENSIEKLLVELVFNSVKSSRIFVSKYVMEQYPISNNNFKIKYYKLPTSFIKKVSVVPIQSRNLKHIIMISSLSVGKGVYTFVELAKKVPEFNFTLVVSAPQNSILNFFGFIEKNNLKIISTQSNIHPFLQSADLLLNLSNPKMCVETFGLTILEGMIYGIPAIVPNIGGPTELVINGYNGYCLDVTDLDTLASKIRFALQKENYSLLANNAFKQAENFI